VRRLDAALEPWDGDGTAQGSVRSAFCEGGVKPPHSKALRAFSSFPGARQLKCMRDCSILIMNARPFGVRS